MTSGLIPSAAEADPLPRKPTPRFGVSFASGGCRCAQGKGIVIETEESKKIKRNEEDLNGVNPFYAILGAGGAAAMSFGSWKVCVCVCVCVFVCRCLPSRRGPRLLFMVEASCFRIHYRRRPGDDVYFQSCCWGPLTY